MPRSVATDPAGSVRARSADQEPEQLRQGRVRRQAERRRQAISRVRAYQQWLRAGSPVGGGQVPAIPSDAEFRIWRAER